MIDLFITCVYTLACVGAGHWVLRALVGRNWALLVSSTASLLAGKLILGQAVLAALWVPIGLVGWFAPPAIVGTLVAIILVSASQVLPSVRNAAVPVREFVEWLRGERVGSQLAAVALALLVLGFGLAAWLMPPLGDAEAFYIPYARIIAAARSLKPMPGPYADFSTIGLMGELHSAALISLDSVSAAKLFVFPLALSAAAMLAAICTQTGMGRLGSMIAVAMLFTTTAFTHHIFDGKTDLFPTALGLMAVWWLLAAGSVVSMRTAYAVAGLCTGFAVVGKFSYIVGFLPAALSLLLWHRPPNAGSTTQSAVLKDTIGRMVLFGLWALVATLPHLAKNTVLFDAPLAPFLGGPQDKSWLHQSWFAPDVTRRIVLTYPLALVFGRYPGQSGNLSYLLLAFLPLAAWLPRPGDLRASKLAQLCAAGAIGTLLWIALRPSMIAPRYILATLLLFYPLVAKAAEQVLIKEASPRWLGAGMIAMLLSAFAVFSYPLLPVLRQVPNVLTGRLDPCALASLYCNPLSRLSNEAAPGDRVYFAGYYGHWLRDDLLQCRDHGAESKLLRVFHGPGLSWEALASGGFRWFAVDLTSHAREWETLAASPRPDYLVVETSWSSKDMVIVRIDDRRGEPPTVCRQVDARAWSVVYP